MVDIGAGIAAEHLPHVFDRFYKADPARVRPATEQGSGLGLSIVKAIVERHGGRIEVSSGPGRTAFTVTLPHASVGRRPGLVGTDGPISRRRRTCSRRPTP